MGIGADSKEVVWVIGDGGMFKIGKSTMILSRGLGMHTIPIRIFNPGELILLKISPE